MNSETNSEVVLRHCRAIRSIGSIAPSNVPFTTVEDGVEWMRPVEQWAMPAYRDTRGAGRGNDARLRHPIIANVFYRAGVIERLPEPIPGIQGEGQGKQWKHRN